jgi:Lon protease-like protein
MSSAFRLPLFPLGLVLFPGVAVPLHLFEPRYRQLLTDVEALDRRFGIIATTESVGEDSLPEGRVGCVAEVTQVERLDDGRSNILVIGRERFALEQEIDDPAPYRVGEVIALPDLEAGSPIVLGLLADDLRAKFRRAIQAVRRLNDDPPTALPALADAPAQLAWTVASLIDIGVEQRQRLLEERSPAERIGQLNALLDAVLPDLEIRAAMHGPRD